jgi:cardiolipin synthase
VSFAEPLIDFDAGQKFDGWLNEQLLIDGDAYFDALLKAIQAASVCIDLEFYIFEDDLLGKRIINALREAKDRGVQVRLLIDGVGSANFINGNYTSAVQRGLDIRIYHPLPWQIMPRLALPRRVGLRSVLRFFSYLNSRNHRKMALIDHKTAFVGSANVSDVHLAEEFSQDAWHDVGVCVEGEPVQLLELVFRRAWDKAWLPEPENETFSLRRRRSSGFIAESDFIVRNDGRLARQRAHEQRLRAIRTARERIWIASAYFVPNGQLLRALMAAAKRGVDVRVLLPRISDVRFMPWVSRVFYESLIKYGVVVYEYSPRVLHAKMMLVDDAAWIGSSNLNHRSLLHDTELDIVVKSAVLTEGLESCFRDDFRRSRKIDRLSLRGESVFHRLLVQLLLYFRHLL